MSAEELVILGCSSQQPTRSRNQGAYFFRFNGEGLLFDPGEGTQRQFIHADLAPTAIGHIFVSHFHGDHCLGVGSMLMRLNLDKVKHPIHCYFPKSGEKYFERLRFGTIYHNTIEVIEHPIRTPGIVPSPAPFEITCARLNHGVENLGYRIKAPDRRRFHKEELDKLGIRGPLVGELAAIGSVTVGGKKILLEEVSYHCPGKVIAVVIDTRPCKAAVELARGADLFLCESTYTREHDHLAKSYSHMTAFDAATIAKEAGAKKLVLTHFSARYNDVRVFENEARQVFLESYAASDFKRFAF